MGNPYELFETDSRAEVEGVWHDYGDFQIRIARIGSGNKKFQSVYEKKTAPYRKAIARNTISEEVAERIINESLVEAVITGWRTKWEGEWHENTVVVKLDGEVQLAEASKKNVLKVLTDLPELAEDIREVARDLDVFKTADRESDSKN